MDVFGVVTLLQVWQTGTHGKLVRNSCGQILKDRNTMIHLELHRHIKRYAGVSQRDIERDREIEYGWREREREREIEIDFGG